MKSSDNGRIFHPFGPVMDESSKILILGSFPSVKSREQSFFTGIRTTVSGAFWRGTRCGVPQTIEDKTDMLLRHHIALWDVLQSCEIVGSSDASIKNAVPNDLDGILKTHKIRAVFSNGSASFRLYRKFIYPKIKRPTFCCRRPRPRTRATVSTH